MAPNTTRRRVLDPNARPCLWCPRSGSERGGVGGHTKGVGSRVVSKGMHSGTVVMVNLLLFEKKKSGLH
jgi:hypothetical protein